MVELLPPAALVLHEPDARNANLIFQAFRLFREYCPFVVGGFVSNRIRVFWLCSFLGFWDPERVIATASLTVALGPIIVYAHRPSALRALCSLRVDHWWLAGSQLVFRFCSADRFRLLC